MKKKNYHSPDFMMTGLSNSEVLIASPTNPNLNDIYGSEDWSV